MDEILEPGRIKIDKSYFKTSSPKEESSLVNFKPKKSFTEFLYSLHKRKRSEYDVERDVEWFEKWFDTTVENYTSLSEKFSSKESERIEVKKKRRW